MDQFGTNFRAPQVDIHDFSMVPRSNVPRSQFKMETNNKLTFSARYLVPIYIQEIVPGDSFACNMTAFCRLATPLYPLMDNLDLETWFFFVPNRLTWSHWQKFMGEQDNPGDSISYTIPQVASPVGGFAQNSVYDYFGLPTTGQTGAGATISVSALPFRAYNIIYNQWFRDENLDNSQGTGATNTVGDIGDGPDPYTNYPLLTCNKRHDYFTSCLPWTQKGGTAITLPLGTTAPVRGIGNVHPTGAIVGPLTAFETGGASRSYANAIATSTAASQYMEVTTNNTGTAVPTIYADLTSASAATINTIRLAVTTQQLLELEARGGTRYVEIILAHFGVRSPDFRLQRPEYIGGGKTPITITPVPQTAATGTTGSTTPLGTLAAAGTAIARHGFKGSFTEHGHIIGLAAVRQNYTYQQGIRRLWKRATKYDFYFPVFANLGEQSVYNYEIYSDGSANDALTFGYQERWAEMRFHPSITCGFFRSTHATPLDAWHLAEKYGSLPTLNNVWINDDTATQLQRAVAAGAAANFQQILADLFFDVRAARPMPMYSVPGLTRF